MAQRFDHTQKLLSRILGFSLVWLRKAGHFLNWLPYPETGSGFLGKAFSQGSPLQVSPLQMSPLTRRPEGRLVVELAQPTAKIDWRR